MTNIKVGDKVFHKEFPQGPKGRVVAKTTKWGYSVPTFLVNWDGSDHQSRHYPFALKKSA